MEDQSTDTSDLTSSADKSAATPVGKRGRHRSFRPRAVTNAETADATVDDTPVGPESTAVEETAAEVEAPTEVAPKPKWRGWFRRRTKPQASADASAELEPEADTEGEVVERKPRRPVGKVLAGTVAAAAALFVAAGAFTGAVLQPYLSDRVLADTKLDIARTASEAITTLFTYTPDDMAQLPARSAKYLGGDLKDAYAKQVDALAATNKQNQIHRSAEVVGAAVESLKDNDATAMVYANITYSSAATKDVPRIFLVSYRLSMQRKGSDWVVTNMPWITSKDLTKINP